MQISIIAAVAEENVIGRDGGLPWHLSDDLKRFKQLTMGHHIVMGRKTFESIGRPLPGRVSVVITRQGDYRAGGVLVVHSLDEALQAGRDEDEVFIIGGAEIYRQALPIANRIYLTRVAAKVEGDTVFPPIDMSYWDIVEHSAAAASDMNDFAHSFQILDRRKQPTE